MESRVATCLNADVLTASPLSALAVTSMDKSGILLTSFVLRQILKETAQFCQYTCISVQYLDSKIHFGPGSDSNG
jgi:hypothetical protein